MNQLQSEAKTIVTLDVQADKVVGIYAVCVNCNKRFTSMHAVSMHLRVTARRHSVNFINYGIYDKRTGLKEMNRPKLNFRDFRDIMNDSTTFTPGPT